MTPTIEITIPAIPPALRVACAVDAEATMTDTEGAPLGLKVGATEGQLVGIDDGWLYG